MLSLFLVLLSLTSASCFAINLSKLNIGTLSVRSRSFSSLRLSKSLDVTDLIPAVDKFARLPSVGVHSTDGQLRASGSPPSGPDPFKLVADELVSLVDYIKEMLVSENPVLTMAASHFFDRVLKFAWCSVL